MATKTTKQYTVLRMVEYCSTSSLSREQKALSVSFCLGVAALYRDVPFSGDAWHHWTRVWETNKDRLLYRQSHLDDIAAGLRQSPISHWELPQCRCLDCQGLRHLMTEYSRRSIERHVQLGSILTFLGILKRVPALLPPPLEEGERWKAIDRACQRVTGDNLPILERMRALAQDFSKVGSYQGAYVPSTGSTADHGVMQSAKALSYQKIDKDTSLHLSALPGRLALVPKSLGKNRVISLIPSLAISGQLGYARDLYRDFRTYSAFRSVVDIHNQDQNRNLVRNADRLGLATLDLSDASDLVSNEQVRYVFSGTPVGALLQMFRTTHVDANGLVELQKFAPMGSGLTFVLESIWFTLIMAATVSLETDDDYARREVQPDRGWSCYGDDLILPSSWAVAVCLRLEQLGFKVNPSKSFWTGGYRESCGVDMWFGKPIPLLRHPRALLDCRATSYDTYLHLRDIANLAYSLGFGRLRKVCFDLAKATWGRLFERDAGWITVTPRELGRWDTRTQQMVYPIFAKKTSTSHVEDGWWAWSMRYANERTRASMSDGEDDFQPSTPFLDQIAPPRVIREGDRRGRYGITTVRDPGSGSVVGF